MPVILILTIWGAALCGVFAGIKTWRIYLNHKHIHVKYSLLTNPLAGDKIIIHNLSKSAVMIEHWELLWVTKKFFLHKKIVPIDIFEDEDSHLNLAANSIQSLNFNGPYHFNWSPEIEKNIRLFIKVRIAGRKGFLTKLVNPRVS